MVQPERVGDGDLQLGVVALGLAIQVDPDAGHGKRVRGLGLVDVRDGDTLRRREQESRRRRGVKSRS